ncbi:hypothetical protein CLAFUW4_07201 [Fulvia fulva]|nr:hypothetical protein CLAFUR4_07209 [Fulvia fulva]WPV16235.1 hypothetical protein CLAFUW4_07201 [Fulvia fulva]
MSWSGFKKNVGRATTQVMMKTGHVEKTSDREYEIEERRYRTLESASLRLQKEAKGYLDSLRAMTASQMRIAETIDAFYGDSGATDGVSRSYKQAVEDLDAETVKALDGPYRCVTREYPKLRKQFEKRFPHEDFNIFNDYLSEVEAELNWKSKERTFSRNTTHYEIQSFDQGSVELIDVIYRTTVLEPINRFCAYFPDINECIKKRNHKMLDYDAMRSKVKKLTEKPDKDPAKLPRTEKETEMVGSPSSFLDLSTDHLIHHLNDDASLMVHSPPKVLDALPAIQHYQLRVAKLRTDEKMALDSVGAPTSPKPERTSSLLRRISVVNDAFWGRTEAQKRVTVAGQQSHSPLSPLALARHFSSPSQRSPIAIMPDVDESSVSLAPVTSPVMLGGGLIPAISPHSTHVPVSKDSSDSTPRGPTRSFSVFRRSSKETPTRNTSMPIQAMSSPSAEGLGISGCSSPSDITPTRLSSMPWQILGKASSGSSGESVHPLFRPSPDATPTRFPAMPGFISKKKSPLGSPASLLDTPTRFRGTPARKTLDATPSRSLPPRFASFSAASSDSEPETIQSRASWQTTDSEVSEDERRDSLDPYSKNSDAATLATLTSPNYNDEDISPVRERCSMNPTVESDCGESIADTDYGKSFAEDDGDETVTQNNNSFIENEYDEGFTQVDNSFADDEYDQRATQSDEGNSTLVASFDEERRSSDTSDTADSSDLDIGTFIQELSISTPGNRKSKMIPREPTSSERRDNSSFIAFLKEGPPGPPGSAKKPEKKFKAPPPVTLPPSFGRPFSAASACPEPLFSPPSKSTFFRPSELEDIMQPLKQEFAEKQANELQKAKVAYDQLNEQLTNELPQLIDLRVPYLDPSFEALVKIQLRFCAEAYSRMAQVQQYLAAETRDQYASGDLDARVEDVLGQIRELSIAGTV